MNSRLLYRSAEWLRQLARGEQVELKYIPIQKMLERAPQALDDLAAKYEAIEKLCDERYHRYGEITILSDDMAVVEYHSKGDDTQYWMAIVNGQETSHLYRTKDAAILSALEYKYDGLNSQFTRFAMRALNMDHQPEVEEG